MKTEKEIKEEIDRLKEVLMDIPIDVRDYREVKNSIKLLEWVLKE